MSDEVQRSLGRIEGKLNQALEWMRDHSVEDREQFAHLSDRIGKVEKKTWAFGGVVSLVVAFVTAKLTGH